MGAGAGVGAVLLSTAGPGQPRGQKGWAEQGPGSWVAPAQTGTESLASLGHFGPLVALPQGVRWRPRVGPEVY